MAEKAGPLSVLIARLRSLGPPSLSAMISRFGDVEEYQEFVMLVREYVPEYESEILLQPSVGTQIQQFASRFQDRYFPLAYQLTDDLAFEDIRYYDLTRAIPVEVRGWTYDEYDYISSDARPGVQLACYLIENPYETDARVSLAEACAEHVGQALVAQVPEGGIKHEVVHRLFDNSPYKPLAMLCDWFWQDTGNFFLDTDYEFLSYNMGEPEWSMEKVQILTRQWQEANAFQDEIDNFVEWLEGDLKSRFQEILDFIAGKGVKKVP